MTGIILGITLIMLLCVLAEKFSDRLGMPALILFMFIGMLFGSDGIFKVPFENFELAERICSVAFVFIMFYGGFNTKWEAAKSIAGKAVTLSTAGVFITAGITALLCNVVLKFSFEESFLIGAVLSSTDAASVFAILRKKKLNLKDGTASLLEVESGSNDPISYLLTIAGFGDYLQCFYIHRMYDEAIVIIQVKISAITIPTVPFIPLCKTIASVFYTLIFPFTGKFFQGSLHHC